ncbi:hypothetical protein [Nitrososphaera sp.]|uniref:hypothetical protein n=1 Tax=Nitrososphaera sp. TaxID=1971748 RepID=UPI00316D915B
MASDAWMLRPFRQRLEVVVGPEAAGDIIKFLESQGAIDGERVIPSRIEPVLESVFGRSTTALLKTIILKKSLAS